MSKQVITKEQFFDFYMLSLIPRGQSQEADDLRTIIVNEIRDNYLTYIEKIVRAEASYQQKRAGLSESPLRTLAKNFHVPGMWAPLFGSAPWARIATALCDLKDAKTEEQMILLIDHIHDLEHNTATVMNRCMDGSTFKQWLDTKQSAAPEQLVKFCSSDVKKIVAKLGTIKRVSQAPKELVLDDNEKRILLEVLKDESQNLVDKDDIVVVNKIIDALYEGSDPFKDVDKRRTKMVLNTIKDNVQANASADDYMDQYRVAVVGKISEAI